MSLDDLTTQLHSLRALNTQLQQELQQYNQLHDEKQATHDQMIHYLQQQSHSVNSSVLSQTQQLGHHSSIAVADQQSLHSQHLQKLTALEKAWHKERTYLESQLLDVQDSLHELQPIQLQHTALNATLYTLRQQLEKQHTEQQLQLHTLQQKFNTVQQVMQQELQQQISDQRTDFYSTIAQEVSKDALQNEHSYQQQVEQFRLVRKAIDVEQSKNRRLKQQLQQYELEVTLNKDNEQKLISTSRHYNQQHTQLQQQYYSLHSQIHNIQQWVTSSEQQVQRSEVVQYQPKREQYEQLQQQLQNVLDDLKLARKDGKQLLQERQTAMSWLLLYIDAQTTAQTKKFSYSNDTSQAASRARLDTASTKLQWQHLQPFERAEVCRMVYAVMNGSRIKALTLPDHSFGDEHKESDASDSYTPDVQQSVCCNQLRRVLLRGVRAR